MASTKNDLASRFQQVSATPQDQVARLNRMSMSQLEQIPIKFGTAKYGMPFKRVLLEDPGYCQWFLGNYSQSVKPAHVEFTHFLRLHIERQELEMEVEDGFDTKPQVDKKPLANKKANPSAPSSCWDLVTSPEPEESVDLQARMDRLEHKMNEMFVQLQRLTVQITSLPNGH